MLEAEPDLIQDLREDLLVSTMRDSSIPSLLAAFLFSKGYHAVATYRISHVIYKCVLGSMIVYRTKVISMPSINYTRPH